MSQPIISLQDINKHYEKNIILSHFNMDINRGELVTAIGSSGCGKTTILKLINGLIRPDAGKVFIEGNDIALSNQNQLRQQIGYVIQGTGLFPHMRIADNMAYVLKLRHTNREKIKTRLYELAELVRLDPSLLNRYPHELSGGQQQRVGLARALAARPSIVLMDEPFGAVDDITRQELQQELKALHQLTQTTMFFITHDIHEAMLLGSRVLVLDEGKIHQFATPKIIQQQPATDFVRKLTRYQNNNASG